MKKLSVILCFILLFTGCAKNSEPSQLEITAGQLCLAYMNHLENSESFSVVSAWGAESSGYSFEIQYTIKNSAGETINETIYTSCPIDQHNIEEIANDPIKSSIYIKKGESERKKELGHLGEDLNPKNIQSYIKNEGAI